MLHSLTTRRAFMVAAAALGATALSRGAYADTYPSRPVRLVLPLGPGGVGDISARIVADKLSDKLGQRFFIENQPSPDGTRCRPHRAQCRARRLYAVALDRRHRELGAAVQGVSARSEILGADFLDRLFRLHDGGQRQVAVPEFDRLSRCRQSQAGRTQCRHHQRRRRAEPHRQLFQASERREFRHRAVSHHAGHGGGADARRRADGDRFLRRAEARARQRPSCAPSPGPGRSLRRRCRTCRPRVRRA